MKNSLKTLRSSALVQVMTLALLVAAGALAQTDICIPAVGGLAGVPTIDGVVEGDSGWNNATRWNLSGDHGATTATKFMAGISGGSLYLGWTVSSPISTPDDTIVLGLSPQDGSAAHDWRIFIQPFDVGMADGTNLVPFSVTWWRDSTPATGWNSGGAIATSAGPADWQRANTRFSRAGSNWAVEMRIPLITVPGDAGLNSGVYLPNPGNYRLYTVVLSTAPFSTNIVSQDPWPPDLNVCGVANPCGVDNTLTHNMPAVGTWGAASFNARPACDGVSLSWADIGVELPVGSGTLVQQIKRYAGPFTETTEAQCIALMPDSVNPGDVGPNNVFMARPLNEMAGPAQVSATFRLADWGIPGTSGFDLLGAPSFLGVAGNPTTQQGIGAGLQKSLTANWAMTYKQSCLFRFHTHECIQVDLDSNDPATHFKNRSVQKNMDIVPGSRFSQQATIGGKWGKLPPGQRAYRFFLGIETDKQVGEGARPPAGEPQRRSYRFQSAQLGRFVEKNNLLARANLLAWIARGYVGTGNKLKINKTEYEIVSRAGDFGYVVYHVGPMYAWNTTFRGNGLKQTSSRNLYGLDIPLGRPQSVTTVIEAQEKKQ